MPSPAVGWPLFWARAEKLGIWNLPDESLVKNRKGYAKIFDGYSTLIEYQRNGFYRAYFYNNPGNQSSWPPAKPMAILDRYIASQFPKSR